MRSRVLIIKVVVHGGAIHLSKEFVCDPPDVGSKFYGCAFLAFYIIHQLTHL